MQTFFLFSEFNYIDLKILQLIKLFSFVLSCMNVNLINIIMLFPSCDTRGR